MTEHHDRSEGGLAEQSHARSESDPAQRPHDDSPGRLPAIYLGHGAPPLLDDPDWPRELGAWAARLPRPKAILIVSAHWQTAPMAISATQPVPLVYDFFGFPERYYRLRYDAPGAPELAAQVQARMPAGEPVLERPTRGLDHGAWVPLLAMYPDHDIPVLQLSMPDLDPQHLFAIGRRLGPLREEGVLIVGSGFMTHGLPFIAEYAAGRPGAPTWSREFDLWAAEALARRDTDSLFDFRSRAPGMPYAHPTVEHFAPLFVTLGAAAQTTEAPDFTIEGYWYGLAKRSFELG
ncbi:MAG TPA: class III extradiol ring-cleavage dioxygenase [Candidatus Limnocylindrales bacterium]|nr:class III extradiol ring-cleavage dioxygenase [Candidatus Limnocylindrales bacterium]